jgi:8-oxo-dGTP pyrophosphatase MutT (NUDIX family)
MLIKSKEVKYQGFYKLEEIIYENNVSREVLTSKDACAALVYHIEKELFVLVEQFRAGANDNVLEVVAGLIDDGENPNECVVREIKEETGCDVIETDYLGWVHQGPATKTGKLHLYYCVVNGYDEPKFDGDEDITLKWVSLNELFNIEFFDMKSIVTLYKTNNKKNLWS